MWAELAKGLWPSSMLASMCRGTLALVRSVYRKSASNAFAVLFLKGVHPLPGGDGLLLGIFARQRSQGGWYTTYCAASLNLYFCAFGCTVGGLLIRIYIRSMYSAPTAEGTMHLKYIYSPQWARWRERIKQVRGNQPGVSLVVICSMMV